MQECEYLTKDDSTKLNEAFKVQRKSVDITPERDKGILKEIERQGTGDECPLKGDTVYIHYVGRLEDGIEFDSSRKGSSKFQLVLDSNDGTPIAVFLEVKQFFVIFAVAAIDWFHFRLRNVLRFTIRLLSRDTIYASAILAVTLCTV